MSKELLFEEWEKEKDINLICSNLLDNANLDIKYHSYPFGIELIFYVIGTEIKVVFTCKEIELFSIEKSSNEEPMFTVLETKIKHKNSSWEISILPEAQINIKCHAFNWAVLQMTESEKRM